MGRRAQVDVINLIQKQGAYGEIWQIALV